MINIRPRTIVIFNLTQIIFGFERLTQIQKNYSLSLKIEAFTIKLRSKQKAQKRNYCLVVGIIIYMMSHFRKKKNKVTFIKGYLKFEHSLSANLKDNRRLFFSETCNRSECSRKRFIRFKKFQLYLRVNKLIRDNHII